MWDIHHLLNYMEIPSFVLCQLADMKPPQPMDAVEMVFVYDESGYRLWVFLEVRTVYRIPCFSLESA